MEAQKWKELFKGPSKKMAFVLYNGRDLSPLRVYYWGERLVI